MDTGGSELRKLAEEYRKRAIEAFERKDLEKTARLLQDAIHLFKDCGEDELYARCLNLLGVVYSNMGSETMAVDYYLEGLEYAKDKNVVSVIPMFYNNIGSRYQELGQHKKAISYFEKALETHKRIKIQEEAAREEEGEQIKYWEHYLYYVLNLAVSWHNLGNLVNTAYYLEQCEIAMEKEPVEEFRLPLLVLKCSISWDNGNREYVKRQLPELLRLSTELNMVYNYVQDVQQLAELLKKTEDYESWYELLSNVEEVTSQQDMVFYDLIAVEMWMEYYHTIGELEKHSALCVRHAQLYQKQKEIENQERVQALDIKIVLREKEEQRKAAEKKAQMDTLTALGNRYALERESKRLIQEAVCKKHPITVGIMDIDCFKQVNDTYGHNEGDSCLRKVGDILKNAVDSYGSVYRFGGDEFVVLIPEGDYEAAERIGERIKRKIKEAGIRNENSTVADIVTISQGYACFRPCEGERLASLLEHADKALYKVKDNGRNGYRIILEDL